MAVSLLAGLIWIIFFICFLSFEETLVSSLLVWVINFFTLIPFCREDAWTDTCYQTNWSARQTSGQGVACFIYCTYYMRYLTYFCNCSSLFTFEFKMLVIVLVIKDTLLNHIHFSTPIFTYAGSVCMYARLRRDGLLYCNELYIWFVFDVFCLMKKVLCVEMRLF